jgi:high-affinity nickel-transport protein
MLTTVLAVGVGSGFRLGLIVTAVALGFRHGIDWDHIAALTDITGAQENPRRSMLLATLYALGHALVVLVLGVLAIVLSEEIPGWLDRAMEHVVGVTLLALGAYVLIALVRQRRAFRMRSRWTLLFAAASRAVKWARGDADEVVVITHEHEHPLDEPHDPDQEHGLDGEHEHARVTVSAVAAPSRARVAVDAGHRHRHRHVATMPRDPSPSYGRLTAFSIGVLHGIGAETPTQVLLFLAAARAGGDAVGVVLLGCFLVGLIASNTVVAASATFGFLRASRNFAAYATTSVVIALASLVVGTLFVLGHGAALPALAGG